MEYYLIRFSQYPKAVPLPRTAARKLSYDDQA